MNQVQQKLRAFINDSFLFGQGTENLGDSDSLIDGGIIDSTGILELVAFVEREFEVRVADDEFVPQNLDSIARITAFVNQKRGVDEQSESEGFEPAAIGNGAPSGISAAVAAA